MKKQLAFRNLNSLPISPQFEDTVRTYRAKVRLGLVPRRKCVTVHKLKKAS
jgi:hypothetical protein